MGISENPVPAPARRTRRIAVGAALTLMLAGILMVCQPFFHILFRYGFLVTLVGIVAFTVASHVKEDRPKA